MRCEHRPTIPGEPCQTCLNWDQCYDEPSGREHEECPHYGFGGTTCAWVADRVMLRGLQDSRNRAFAVKLVRNLLAYTAWAERAFKMRSRLFSRDTRAARRWLKAVEGSVKRG